MKLTKFFSSRFVGLSKNRLLKNDRQTIGKIGEEAALFFLQNKGYQLLVKNWRVRIGEVDLILRDRHELVFVEVKARTASRFAERFLLANVFARKQKTLIALARLYIAINYFNLEKAQPRIDVVGVLIDPTSMKPKRIEHIIAAVEIR